MIIKKCSPLKGKSLKEILFQIGFKKKREGLRMLFLINRKGISKIGVYVAKKNIRDSVERNIIKRRIRNAYKILIKKNYFIYKKLIIIMYWDIKIILSSKRIEVLMKKIFNTLLLQISPNLIFYMPL